MVFQDTPTTGGGGSYPVFTVAYERSERERRARREAQHPVMYQTKYSSTYQDYLKSDHWKNLREEIIKERGLICEISGIPIHRGICNVHHLTYRNLTDVLHEDLMILSIPIHNVVHKWKDDGFLVEISSNSKRRELIRMFKGWVKGGMRGGGVFKKCRKWILQNKGKQTKLIAEKFFDWRSEKKKKKRRRPIPHKKTYMISISKMTEQERHNHYGSQIEYRLPGPWPESKPPSLVQFTDEELTPF